MARKQGTLNVPNNAEVKAAAPFDARLVVPLKADLLTYQYPYKGMLVSVTDDTTNNGVYQLVGSDASLAASWEKVGSGVPSGGTTGQILSKVSDDYGDATWVDDQGAYLMAEECEYGSHTETREVEVEYYTWDRSPGTSDIPVVTNRKLRSTDAKYDPATFASSNADTISFLFQRLYNNKNQSRLLLNSKVVEVDDPNPRLHGVYYFFTFRCGGTTYYVRTSTTDAKSGVFVKNNMFTQEPPFDALNAVDVSAIYSYGTGDYYEVYTRHTRTETREVEVPDYIHNVSCIVKNDLNLDPRTIPSGWGIAAKDVVQIPNNGGEWGEATIDVSKYGFTSADDYSASLLVAGGAGGYGGVNTYIKSKTASSFVIHWARVSGGSATRVDYEYTIIGKGYGYNVSGWGVAKVGTARLTAAQTSGWYVGTVSVTDLGFASGDDYTVQFSVVGGNNDWGKVGDKHVAEKTTSQFIIKGSYDGSGTAPTYVDVVYTIVARGYGGSGGSGLPSGGVKGDIIVKQSSADGDVSWTPLDVSEWGVAKSDVVNVPITNQQGSFTISIADLGIASVSDYNVVFSIVGGTGAGAWGDSTVFAHSRTTSAIMGTVNTLQGDIQSVLVSYAIVAKGYGTTVGGSGGSIDVDTAMSDTSENAVQNKVIKAYVDGADAQKATGYFERTDYPITLDTVGQPSYALARDVFTVEVENHKPYTYEFTATDVYDLTTRYVETIGKTFVVMNEDNETIYITMKGALPDNVQYVAGSANPVVDLTNATVTLTKTTFLQQIDDMLIPRTSDEVFVFDVDSDQFTEDPENPGGKHYGMTIDSPTFDEIMENLVVGKIVFVRMTFNGGNSYDFYQLNRGSQQDINGHAFDLEFPQGHIWYYDFYIRKRGFGTNTTTYFGVFSDIVVDGGGSTGETPTLDAVLQKGNTTERDARFTDDLNGRQVEVGAGGTYMTGNGTEGMRQFSVNQNGISAVDNLVGTITPKFVVPFEPSGEDQVAMSDAVKASFRNALDMPTLVTQTQQTPGQPITATFADGDNEIRFDVAGGTIQMDFTDAGATNTKFLATQGYVDEAVGDLTTLTTTDQTSAVGAINELDAAVKGLGEPFRVKNWASNTLNVEIPYCTEDIGNGSIAKMVFSIDAVEGADYQIVGMIAYEVFDAASGGNRINCWPVCQFTGNGQKELSVRWMCGGTTRKTAKRINAWVLLKHR